MRGVLYQELPRIEASPLDGWSRWLVPAAIFIGALTAAALLLFVEQPLFAAALVFAGLAGGAFMYLRPPPDITLSEPLVVGPDFSLVGAALGLSREPAALTTGEGSLLIVNSSY